MRQATVLVPCLVVVLTLSAAPAHAGEPVTTETRRTERLRYLGTGCDGFVRISERYRLRYRVTEQADGRTLTVRVMRGTMRFVEDGVRFRGRFVDRSRTNAFVEPGRYRHVYRLDAAGADGTALTVRERERTLLPSDGPPIVLERAFERTCA